MRVLYYATAYHAAHGGSNHAKAFVNECKKNRLVSEIKVFPDAPAMKEKLKAGRWQFLKTTSFIQPFTFYRRNRFHLAAIKQCIQEFNPDVIHIRLDSNFLQIKKLKDWFPGVVISTEVNASPFDESFKNILFKTFFKKIECKYLSYADLNFFVSDVLRKKIMRTRLKNDRDFVVHNGVDISLFDKPRVRNTDSTNINIIYIGTIEFHKQVGLLLMAYAKAHEVFPGLRLTIVGDGPDRTEMEDLAARLGVSNKIKFTGWVKHNEIPGILAHADIGIHHYANSYMSPIKLFEYMASGLPVIGPDTPAVKEVFKDRIHILITDGTVDDLTSKILIAIKDPGLRETIAKGGEELVRNNYTWERNADQILSAFHGVLTKRKA